MPAKCGDSKWWPERPLPRLPRPARSCRVPREFARAGPGHVPRTICVGRPPGSGRPAAQPGEDPRPLTDLPPPLLTTAGRRSLDPLATSPRRASSLIPRPVPALVSAAISSASGCRGRGRTQRAAHRGRIGTNKPSQSLRRRAEPARRLPKGHLLRRAAAQIPGGHPVVNLAPPVLIAGLSKPLCRSPPNDQRPNRCCVTGLGDGRFLVAEAGKRRSPP